ncbi:MAG TPA: hypothetical protein VEH80_12035 [Candidatus Bathyarchaeia archaeon]|nr:hypothetical protein [Candidatus Bathyarchaeia archaeon]
MKGQGSVMGILIEGNDGHEYLLGFRSGGPVPTPTLSRRQPDGTFLALDDVHEASRLAATQLGLGPQLVGPGMGQHLFLWNAFREALRTLPAIPSWPTWRP